MISGIPVLYIAGLGNLPYPKTRHSIGQLIIDSLAARLGVTLSSDRQGISGRKLVTIGDTTIDLVLFKTKALMNISGPPITQILPSRSRHGTLSNLAIISDSLQQKPKAFHVRLGGSANGHNGLKSLIAALGNNNQFWQLRIGVGNNRPSRGEGAHMDSADYVMQRLAPDEIMYWSENGPGINLLLQEIEKIALQNVETPTPAPLKTKSRG